MQPYAPPRTEAAATSQVDVDVKRALPPICLKCGSSHDVTPRPETLQVVSPKVRLIALGLVVAGVAAVVVFDSPAARAGIIVGIVVAARLVRMGLRPALPKVDLGLPLCASCNERWTVGMRRRRIYRAIIVGGTITMVVLTAVSGWVLVPIAFFPIIFGVVIANAMLRLRSRVVLATGAKGDVVTLALVHPDAVAAIRASSGLPSAVPSAPAS